MSLTVAKIKLHYFMSALQSVIYSAC